MYAFDMENFVRVDDNGHLIVPGADLRANSLLSDVSIVNAPADWSALGGVDATHSTVTIPGQLSTGEDYDLIAVDLTAGETYTFAYRSDDGSLEDPLLALFNSTFDYITEDDDGGAGRSAMLTFTPTESGTYYLYATSWVAGDTGNYTIDMWSPNDGTDAPATIDSTTTLNEGTNYAYLDEAGDIDVYQIDVTAGQVYTFNYSGGVGFAADWDLPNTPGESIGYLELLDADGNVVSAAVNYDTALTFISEQDGTYYLRVSGYEEDMTGGYTLDHAVRPLSSFNPLEALNWDSAPNVPFADTDGDGVGDTAYIYFAPEGENLGFLQGEPGSTEEMLSFGFNAFEQQAILDALNAQYGFLLGVDYVTTTNVEEATFRLILTEDEPYGARFLNYAPNYGAQSGTGIFVRDNAGWSYDQQQSLLQGGFDYALILHEFGHAHGIAHPHDAGGGSEIMLGVSGAQGSLGVYDLNQGVYTVMSYNDAWELNPAGPSELYAQTVDNGWSGTLGAFDIAILQQRYGLAERNTGDDVYELTDVVDEAFYQTIWDSAGNDTIAYNGTLDAHIDLMAATLDYSPTGGGVLSFLYNDPETVATTHPALLLRGGFTIANGVVIENATGGSGNDVLIGNDANNVLRGNDGDDTLIGRGGNDELFGGAGADAFVFVESSGGKDKIRDFESGEDVIDLTAFGIGSGDVKIAGANVFADTNGDGRYDLHIVVQGDKAKMSDIILDDAGAAAMAASHPNETWAYYQQESGMYLF